MELIWLVQSSIARVQFLSLIHISNNKPTRFPKGIIAIVVAGVAVIAAIIIFVCVGKNVTDYKKNAKQYVKAVAECEWKMCIRDRVWLLLYI